MHTSATPLALLFAFLALTSTSTAFPQPAPDPQLTPSQQAGRCGFCAILWNLDDNWLDFYGGDVLLLCARLAYRAEKWYAVLDDLMP